MAEQASFIGALRQNPIYFVFVMFMVGASSYVDRFALSIFAQPLMHELRISEVGFGVLSGAAFGCVYAIAILVMGRFADSHNRRNLIAAGILVWTVANAACAFCNDFGQIFAARAFVAVGQAMVMPASMSLTSARIPAGSRGMAFSILILAMWIGGALAPVSGGTILSLAQHGHFAGWPVVGPLAPWRQAMVLLSIPNVLIFLFAVLVAEPHRGAVATNTGHAVRRALTYLGERRGYIASLYAGLAFVQIIIFALLAWLPDVFGRRYQLLPAQLGELISATTLVACIVGTLLGGWLSDVFRRAQGSVGLLKLSLYLSAAAAPALLLGTVDSIPISLFGCCAGLALAVAALAAMTVVALEVPPDTLGLVGALQGVISVAVGLSLGPLLVALIDTHLKSDRSSPAFSLVMITVAAAVAGAVCLKFATGFHAGAMTDREGSDAEPLSHVGPGWRKQEQGGH